MEMILFYLVAAIAVFSTVRVISNSNPIHALLNLVVSLLAVANSIDPSEKKKVEKQARKVAVENTFKLS